MQKKVVQITSAVVVSAAVLALLWFFLGADEDRPDIIVRNRNLKIEIDKDAKDWKALGSDKMWKPDHDDGKSVKEFVVSATNSTSGCTSLIGEKVEVIFESGGTSYSFLLTRVEDSSSKKYEPVLTAPEDLEHDGNKSKLKFKVNHDGGITKLKVNTTKECDFPQNKDVEIKVEMQY